MKFIFLTLVLLATAACLLIFAAHGNRLSSEAANALHAPEKVVLYSLVPESRRNTNDMTLHGFKVLKHLTLEGKQAAMASAAFESAISQGKNGLQADCFNPRHALRIMVKDQTYDYLLCYECGALSVYRGNILMETVGAAGSPEVLNLLLSEAKVPLSKSPVQ
jgi:hypothetical protein